MPSLISLLSFGFLLGIRHATDADHITAITTFVSKEHGIRNASRIGILWGLGHSVSVTVIALPIILLSVAIPSWISLAFEFSVGIMLIILGLITLTRYLPIAHSHEHEEKAGRSHTHIHTHVLRSFHSQTHHLSIFHTIRPLFVGIIHGLAGSTAITLLILSTFKDPMGATAHLLVFHTGVIFGMVLITTLFGISVTAMQKRSESFHKYLVLASGIFSFLFGVYIIYEIGIVKGLFYTFI